ncbi:MAG: SH3 domain-containing protein, partial [archaeon]|nr:SH3 domain-containing protein [archaeon]
MDPSMTAEIERQLEEQLRAEEFMQVAIAGAETWQQKRLSKRQLLVESHEASVAGEPQGSPEAFQEDPAGDFQQQQQQQWPDPESEYQQQQLEYGWQEDAYGGEEEQGDEGEEVAYGDDDEFPMLLIRKATHAFAAETPKELSFAKGEVLVIEREEAGWCQGYRAKDPSALGWFPVFYLGPETFVLAANLDQYESSDMPPSSLVSPPVSPPVSSAPVVSALLELSDPLSHNPTAGGFISPPSGPKQFPPSQGPCPHQPQVHHGHPVHPPTHPSHDSKAMRATLVSHNQTYLGVLTPADFGVHHSDLTISQGQSGRPVGFEPHPEANPPQASRKQRPPTFRVPQRPIPAPAHKDPHSAAASSRGRPPGPPGGAAQAPRAPPPT